MAWILCINIKKHIMENSKKDKDLNPDKLPEKEVFQEKEIYQFKQPPDSGQPLEKETSNAVRDKILKENEKTSKEKGLNEKG
jgi:hypothetical protein